MTELWALERLFWPFNKIRGSLHYNFRKQIPGNILDHKIEKGYSMDYFKTNFRSLVSFVFALQDYEYLHAGFQSDFFGLMSKFEALRVLIF